MVVNNKDVETVDPKLLKIKGKSYHDQSKDYVRQLSRAIFAVIKKHQSANLRCVGAAALNNAVKGSAVAGLNPSEEGCVSITPSFSEAQFDVFGKTAIILEAKPYISEVKGISDETLLKTSGSHGDDNKAYIKKLSKAICACYLKHGVVHMRCVGAAALNNAMKSIIIANGEMAMKGKSITVVPKFDVAVFEGVGERTSILLTVVNPE